MRTTPKKKKVQGKVVKVKPKVTKPTAEQEEIIAFEFWRASASASRPMEETINAIREGAKRSKPGYETVLNIPAESFARVIETSFEAAFKRLQMKCFRESRVLYLEGLVSTPTGFAPQTVGVQFQLAVSEEPSPPPALYEFILDAKKRISVKLPVTNQQAAELLSRTSVIREDFRVYTSTGLLLGTVSFDHIEDDKGLALKINARLAPKKPPQSEMPFLQMSDLKEMAKRIKTMGERCSDYASDEQIAAALGSSPPHSRQKTKGTFAGKTANLL